MKKIIVCTSINPMTEALKEFDKLEDWELIVVEDLKTPAESYKGMRGHYLTTQEQAWNCPELSAMLGWNTVDRRNLGYLEAYNRGADVIVAGSGVFGAADIPERVRSFTDILSPRDA